MAIGLGDIKKKSEHSVTKSVDSLESTKQDSSSFTDTQKKLSDISEAIDINPLNDQENKLEEKSFNNNISSEKESAVRPWESFDKRGLQTRTISAREAVKKARDILQRNHDFSQTLKAKGYVPKNTTEH